MRSPSFRSPPSPSAARCLSDRLPDHRHADGQPVAPRPWPPAAPPASASANASSALERCAAPLGTVSLIENQSAGWYTILRNEYKLPPTANLLRLLIQQSNCFVVVERGAAGMNAMTRERALMQSGEMRQGSNFGARPDGRVRLRPVARNRVQQQQRRRHGRLRSAAWWAGATAACSAAVGGNLQTKEASALLTLIDNRSGVQVGGVGRQRLQDRLRRASAAVVRRRRCAAASAATRNTAQGKVISGAPSWTPSTRWSCRCAATRRRPCRARACGGGGRLGRGRRLPRRRRPRRRAAHGADAPRRNQKQ